MILLALNDQQARAMIRLAVLLAALDDIDAMSARMIGVAHRALTAALWSAKVELWAGQHAGQDHDSMAVARRMGLI